MARTAKAVVSSSTSDRWDTEELTGEQTCEWRNGKLVATGSVFKIGVSDWCCSVDAGEVSFTYAKPLSEDDAKSTAKRIAMTWLSGCVAMQVTGG